MLSILRDVVRIETLRANYSNVKGDVSKIAGQLTVALLTTALESAKKTAEPLVDGLTKEEIALLGDGTNKIGTVRMVRERTKMDLKEAKDLVENHMEKHLGYRWKQPDYSNSDFGQ